ncbi:MAG: hypothetical protein IIB36_16115 [Gemmatimonadetes bacterium]|nr:hypothetical protein [Gemmatimonadota bacterium]
MVALFWLVFWTGLVLLAFAAGISLRLRLREHLRPRIPVVDDEALDAILITGTLTADEDEPLDIREIDEEERKFWSESWDEPEEW